MAISYCDKGPSDPRLKQDHLAAQKVEREYLRWQLVPAEPDQVMITAGLGQAGKDVTWADLRAAWVSMLGAAPRPPTSVATDQLNEVVDEVLFDELLEAYNAGAAERVLEICPAKKRLAAAFSHPLWLDVTAQHHATCPRERAPLDVDLLAQEIRRVDGSHSLGAAQLAEALLPFLRASVVSALSPYQSALALLVDLAVPGQDSGDLLADAQAVAAAVTRARPTLALLANARLADPIAWMTHHDEPMIFPTRAEAELHCDAGEEPIPLHQQAVTETPALSSCGPDIETTLHLSDKELRNLLEKAGAKELGDSSWEWECTFEHLIRQLLEHASRNPAFRARQDVATMADATDVDALKAVDQLLLALRHAEAALSDIGDADREPGDDVAWCERRAAEALPVVRAAIAATKEGSNG